LARKMGKRMLSNPRVVALLLAALTIALLAATAPGIGLTWDEPAYIVASESYVAWLQALVTRPAFALSAQGIETYWNPNHEHPPLDKVWSGLVWDLARFVTDDLTAHRLGNILLAGGLVGMVYLVTAHGQGRQQKRGGDAPAGFPAAHEWLAGLVAAAALVTMPRFFFHAHLAALDVPAAVAVFGVTFFFWQIRERPEARWDAWLGVLWGLALATKVNAIFVPPTLLLWMLLFQRRLYLFRRLVVMGVIGVPVSLVLWPWLYHDFGARLAEYVLFVTVDHWQIGQWYLGRFYMPPPWHFSFVMTAVVVPLGLTVLYLLGIARTAVDRRVQALGGLLVLSALVPMLALATGQSMVYDNDRLFMPSFPYLAALAGLGFEWIARGLHRVTAGTLKSPWPSALTAAVAGLAFIPHVALTAGLYPHLLSYYSEAIGGLPGAARLGLETTYWCETYAAALPYLNAHARPGDVIWVEDWSHDVLLYYRLHGQLGRDLEISWPRYGTTVFAREQAQGVEVSIEDADYVVVQYRQTGLDGDVQRVMHLRKPVYQLTYRGIPLMGIYAR
jgi:4-amino-4-deoxy-L-arabinose transferase-like glycosyltransferase